MPKSAEYVFARRSLWESAVISYGRVGQGDKRRKIDLDALFEACGDPEVSALHDEIQNWRHGHVGHRNGREFESVEVLLGRDALPVPTALRIVIGTAVGPVQHDDLMERFAAHALLLRNTIWEKFMLPLAVKLVGDAQRREPIGDDVALPVEFTPDRFVATLDLWRRPSHPHK
ncbi:hypothetical protein [Nocardia sp. NPDC057272]|uniref:hypothetical protein n=1 Tax=Nocardia sp. NPDC057272 TaxID=3346079 RepID=UPI003634D459